ncbi:cyclic AMP-responsive element-binding protein 1-like isoform X2 [Melanotaenia boesemani]|uniref:cyclic AMP-responsive element-binding protein 1-like isoform X2 n=1 Tax=Melanotaenia boesemani TaxID=1250792 RepID=UPI001C046291|nr:cyclic AMP-responsive element-binding protein 1-like isoform X2 [Melanotaenia boesemani]
MVKIEKDFPNTPELTEASCRIPISQMVKIEKDLPNTPVGCATDLSGELLTPKTVKVDSTSMTSTQTPNFPSGTCFQPYQQMLNHTGAYCLPVVPAPFIHDGTQPWSSLAVNTVQTPQLPTGSLQRSTLNWQLLHNPQTTPVVLPQGDLNCCQLPNPTSSIPQEVTTPTRDHRPKKPVKEDLQKRALRLMKNREAARECRRKKKEYVTCLENRVAVLENQNKILIEELRALRDIYQHKVE